MKEYTIEEIEKLMEGITPREWGHDLNGFIAPCIDGEWQPTIARIPHYGEFLQDKENADFIAAAPSIIQFLVEQLKGKEREVARECAEIANKYLYDGRIERAKDFIEEIREKYGVDNAPE